jgi:uncharacterized protein YdaU (DUF1376 family)
MHYYQFNISDWVLHTNHLSLEEEGVYRRILDFYYETELPIPEETQSVIRRLKLGSYSVIFGLILAEFFILKQDGWHNLRADEELIKYKEKAEIAKSNGMKGGRPKKQAVIKEQVTKSNNPEETQSVILANPEETGSKANYKLITTNKELLTNKRYVQFTDFYSIYPKKEKRVEAEKIWLKIPDELKETIIEDVKNRTLNHEGWRDKQFIPQPSAYLNGKRWEDDIRPYQQAKQSHLEKTISSLTDFITDKGQTNDNRRLT